MYASSIAVPEAALSWQSLKRPTDQRRLSFWVTGYPFAFLVSPPSNLFDFLFSDRPSALRDRMARCPIFQLLSRGRRWRYIGLRYIVQKIRNGISLHRTKVQHATRDYGTTGFFEKANTSDLDTTDLGTTAQTGLGYIMRNRNITYGIRVHQGIQY